MLKSSSAKTSSRELPSDLASRLDKQSQQIIPLEYGLGMYYDDKQEGAISLEGHRRDVGALAVLPDGQLASGSDDETIKIWDPETGRCLRTLEGHRCNVRALAVLPHGQLASSSGGTIKIFSYMTTPAFTFKDAHYYCTHPNQFSNHHVLIICQLTLFVLQGAEHQQALLDNGLLTVLLEQLRGADQILSSHIFEVLAILARKNRAVQGQLVDTGLVQQAMTYFNGTDEVMKITAGHLLVSLIDIVPEISQTLGSPRFIALLFLHWKAQICENRLQPLLR